MSTMAPLVPLAPMATTSTSASATLRMTRTPSPTSISAAPSFNSLPSPGSPSGSGSASRSPSVSGSSRRPAFHHHTTNDALPAGSTSSHQRLPPISTSVSISHSPSSASHGHRQSWSRRSVSMTRASFDISATYPVSLDIDEKERSVRQSQSQSQNLNLKREKRSPDPGHCSLPCSPTNYHSQAPWHSSSHPTQSPSAYGEYNYAATPTPATPASGPTSISFPPAWAHSVTGESRRPGVGDILRRAVRERSSSGNCKGGALGRSLIIGWVLTTLGFVFATAFWKGELFAALDQLSKDLYDMGYQGLVVFGLLIFITTIPPLPLYSTLIVLSGYTFGVWNGFVVSYLASLIGAVIVFIVSRTLLRDTVTRSLASSPTATSLLQIIPANPHLLLLIRIAPYPYNLLNVILASSPTLTLTTYTSCTAISLCKLVLHTWIGAGIHDLSAAYNPDGHSAHPGHDGNSTNTTPAAPTEEDLHRDRVKAYVTWGGIILCIALFVYLTHLAKRAIAKAQDEQRYRGRSEEEVAFLSHHDDSDA